MRRFLRRHVHLRSQPIGLLFALLCAIAFGAALGPLEGPHEARAQPATGPAQILQNTGSCAGISGTMFSFFFSTNPLHYTQTFDRAGNVGLCTVNGAVGAFNGSLVVPAAGSATFNELTASSCLGLNASNVLTSFSNCVSSIVAGSNITVTGGAPTPTVALASPTTTAAASPAGCAGWMTATGGALAVFPCPATPYPTPIPTSANANCSFAGFTLTCTTPAPSAEPGAIVMTLPTQLASTGATTFPVPINPNMVGLQVTGAASGCATAGTGTPETFVFLQSTSFGGTYVTAAPTTFVLATGNAQGVIETIAPTAFVTPTANGGFIVAKVLAQNGTTARSGNCSYTLFFTHT